MPGRHLHDTFNLACARRQGKSHRLFLNVRESFFFFFLKGVTGDCEQVQGGHQDTGVFFLQKHCTKQNVSRSGGKTCKV